MIKKIFLTAFIILVFSTLFAQVYSIDYYGVTSPDLDKNMISMTSDLYFTQLTEIQGFNVTDKRDLNLDYETLDQDLLSSSALSFFAQIRLKESSGKWLCTIHLVNKDAGSDVSRAKEYDSYYKILMEPKSSLQESFVSLIKKESPKPRSNDAVFAAKSNPSKIASSTESLAGTWSAEQNIDKVVIMRGGRGFVIFKNGASMNIQISIENTSIKITQTGKPNASYFPELPRQTAIEAALTAEPITWELYMTNDDCLSGTKRTLMPNGDAAEVAIVDVKWTRRQ